jgi:spermidine synthase
MKRDDLIPSQNRISRRWIFFVFFFVSGFSSLVYQVVWTRLAFASFGIITPVLSVVISVFMLGLSVGSWAAGRFVVPMTKKTGLSAAMFYAATEFLIGLGAYLVPRLFLAGQHILLSSGETNSMRYLFLSAVVLAISILPWCLFMGATFPFMMAYLREQSEGFADSFSYLYVANVLGAMCGTFLTAIALVELFGFRGTLQLAAVGNFAIALSSGFLASRKKRFGTDQTLTSETATAARENSGNSVAKWILFSTGFSSMAMEVVWTRLFTPVLKTQVYSFALIVGVYLGATLCGSLSYRRHLKKNSSWQTPTLVALLTLSAFFPILAADPRFVQMDEHYTVYIPGAMIVLASIFPICAILGYLTPGLIDQFSLGNPADAGRAYAINVLGCILGPLAACYVLLPFMGERAAVTVLSLPFLVFYFHFWKSLPTPLRLLSGPVGALLVVYSLFFSHSFAESLRATSSRVEERRDYAASVISADPDGAKELLVNGVGMTTLTPITKFMVHLPLAYHKDPPQSVLVICFGMGTTYRSALSWDVETTAVELIPDVPKAFGYYHANAAEVLNNPRGRIVIDDGRRFLNRTQEKYDVVVIDPPPPIEAAGSSLLYSTEFYDLLKQHLKPKGIVQMWLPKADPAAKRAVAGSICKSFPYVVSFPSIQRWGMHFLASMEPIEKQTPDELLLRMPVSAKKDLLEWAPGQEPSAYLGNVVPYGVRVERAQDSGVSFEITDDDPVNEYFLMDRMGLFKLR